MFRLHENPPAWQRGVFRISLVEPEAVEPTVFQLKVTTTDLGSSGFGKGITKWSNGQRFLGHASVAT